MNAMVKKVALSLLLTIALLCNAQIDRDIDNDGQWDYGRGELTGTWIMIESGIGRSPRVSLAQLDFDARPQFV